MLSDPVITINDEGSSQRPQSQNGSSNSCCLCNCHLKTVESNQAVDAPGIGCDNVKDRIEKDKNRINVKSKRKRFLFKKAIELSQMCDLKIVIVVQDQIVDRITTYCSGKLESGIFSTNDALELVN